MSYVKKICLVFALLFVSVNLAKAEKDGAFIGVDVGYGFANIKDEYTSGQTLHDYGYKGYRYGFVAGYKYFFEKYADTGIRAYLSANNGSAGKLGKNRDNISNLNILANVDLLLNFCDCNKMTFGAFVGASAGYTDYHIRDNTYIDGFDLGVNFGFRGVIAGNHSIEFWNRASISTIKTEEIRVGGIKQKTFSQPIATGIRYVYAF